VAPTSPLHNESKDLQAKSNTTPASIRENIEKEDSASKRHQLLTQDSQMIRSSISPNSVNRNQGLGLGSGSKYRENSTEMHARGGTYTDKLISPNNLGKYKAFENHTTMMLLD
jgi:hypothetical protein